MWKSGAQTSVTSSSRVSNARAALTLFHRRLPWVSIAPFGRPVVPEVYMMIATSPSPTSSSRGSGAASATIDP